MFSDFIQNPLTLDAVFAVIGALLWAYAGMTFADRQHPTRMGTALYWVILGTLFLFGSRIPHWISGILVVALVVIEGFGKVKATDAGHPKPRDLRAWSIAPVLAIPVVTFAFAGAAKLFNADVGKATTIGLGVSGVVAAIIALAVFRDPVQKAFAAGRRLTEDIGALHIYPQLLASLGAVFTAAGVGTVFAGFVGKFAPGGPLAAGIVFFGAMSLFTALMGNSFAAFSVIMTGIGIPLVIKPYGLDPAFVAILGLTSASCGTLCTPMAANFNILPVGLYEMKDPSGVIRIQWKYAIPLWLSHVAIYAVWLKWKG